VHDAPQPWAFVWRAACAASPDLPQAGPPDRGSGHQFGKAPGDKVPEDRRSGHPSDQRAGQAHRGQYRFSIGCKVEAVEQAQDTGWCAAQPEQERDTEQHGQRLLAIRPAKLRPDKVNAHHAEYGPCEGGPQVEKGREAHDPCQLVMVSCGLMHSTIADKGLPGLELGQV